MERIDFYEKKTEPINFDNVLSSSLKRKIAPDTVDLLQQALQRLTDERHDIVYGDSNSWMSYFAYLTSFIELIEGKKVTNMLSISTEWSNVFNNSKKVKENGFFMEQLICLVNAGICRYNLHYTTFDFDHLTKESGHMIIANNKEAAGYFHEAQIFMSNHNLQPKSVDLSLSFIKFMEYCMYLLNNIVTYYILANSKTGETKVIKTADLYNVMYCGYQELLNKLEKNKELKELYDHIEYNCYYSLYMTHFTLADYLLPKCNQLLNIGQCLYHFKQCEAAINKYASVANKKSEYYSKLCSQLSSIQHNIQVCVKNNLSLREHEAEFHKFGFVPLNPCYKDVIYPANCQIISAIRSSAIDDLISKLAINNLIPLNNNYSSEINEHFMNINKTLGECNAKQIIESKSKKNTLPDDYKQRFIRFIKETGFTVLEGKNQELIRIINTVYQLLANISELLNSKEGQILKSRNIELYNNTLMRIQEYKTMFDKASTLSRSIQQQFEAFKNKYALYNCSAEELENRLPPLYNEIEMNYVNSIETAYNQILEKEENIKRNWTNIKEKLEITTSLSNSLVIASTDQYNDITFKYVQSIKSQYQECIEKEFDQVNRLMESLHQTSIELLHYHDEYLKKLNIHQGFYDKFTVLMQDSKKMVADYNDALTYYNDRYTELKKAFIEINTIITGH